MNKSSKRKGFSLVELVVVILIIAILAAAIFLGGATVIKQARESQVKTDLRNLATYVQDMFYANPDMQYLATYNDGEHFTYDPTSKTPTFAGEASTDTKAGCKVLGILNEKYLTADFQLDGAKNVDAWDNPYCFSYDQVPSTGTGKSSSCIVVINSLGANSLDETSDGATGGEAKADLTPSTGKSTMVAGSFKLGMAGDATSQRAWDSAEEFANALKTDKLGDDYGVIVIMIDGQVSTAYYGFK